MEIVDHKDISHRMEGAISVFEGKINGIRGGRVSANLLDSIKVDAYGSMMPLNQVASVTVVDAQHLSVQVWDATLVTAAEKAIRDSDLDLNPQAAGSVLRINVPPPSEERRGQLVALAGKFAEEARVAVRGVRRSGMDVIKAAEKAGHVSEDDLRREQAEVQKQTDHFIERINQILDQKETELKTV